MKRLLTLLLSALMWGQATAENFVDVSVKHFTTFEGLNSNSVRYIFQDSSGFMWFGMLNSGLCRYDGYTFTSLQPNYDDPISLADFRISKIFEDQNRHLWILTLSDEVSCYDLNREEFVDFTGTGDYRDRYGYIAFIGDDVWLWGKTQGARVIHFEDGNFRSEAFTKRNGTLSSDFVNFVGEGADGDIWIGTDNGLSRYDGTGCRIYEQGSNILRFARLANRDYFLSDDGRIRRYIPTESNLVNRVQIRNIIPHAEMVSGDMLYLGDWVIFTKHGGYRFDPESEQLMRAPAVLDLPDGRVQINNRGNYLLSNNTQRILYVDGHEGVVRELNTPYSQVGDVTIERYTFTEDSRGIVWISTHINGLYAYDVEHDRLQHIKINEGGSDIQLYIMEDHSGCLWAASEYAGVFQLQLISRAATFLYPNPTNQNEYANMIRSMFRVEDELWLCTRDGMIYRYNADTMQLIGSENYEANIYAATVDAEGERWIGSRKKELQVGDAFYHHNLRDTTALSSDNIYCFGRDHKNRMWIGTFGGGLNVAEADGAGSYTFRRFFNDTYSRSRVRALCCDRNGYMWSGTNDGVIVFHPDSLLSDPTAYYSYNYRNHQLRNNEIRSIFEDSKGRVWIAQSGYGIAVCQPDRDYDRLSLRHYGVGDGLIFGAVQSFAEDREGKIWIATESGISRFDPEQDEFYNYIFSSNEQSNICCENSALTLPDGRIAIGTNYGLALINPKLAHGSHPRTKVEFTDLKINGISSQPTDPDSPIERAMVYTPEVTLRHNQNSIAVHFSTFDMTHFSKPQYSYKLENYDEEWSQPSDLNFAAYKNLPSGRYRLKVRADNRMSDQEHANYSELVIRVRPPWYGTTLAYVCFLVLLLIILYMVYRTLLHVNELRNKIAIEQQLTEYKLAFFTNISHEFRTPLTLILSALERMRRCETLSGELRDALVVMEKGSQRMMRLVNQLLEFRKMQNNKLALSLEQTDVMGYLHEIWLLFRDAAASKQIDFGFQPSVATYTMYIDKGMVDKIAYNLLSNALKYTPTGGRITFTITVDEEHCQLLLRVTDSGVGVPRDKQSQLFSRFMHTSFSTNSVGVGLHLTHELVTVHKGTIRFEENPTGGAIFTVTLPTDPACYEKGDFIISSALDRQPEEPTKASAATPSEATDAAELPIVEELDTPQRPINPQRILLIEDDADIRALIIAEMSSWFEVIAAADGKEGLQRVEEDHEIDLIICDVMMPELDGFEVTRRLKNNFGTCHIPIILLTALSSSGNHLKGIESGADAYITKPFSPRLVLARVLKLIEQRSRLKEKFSNDLSVKSSILCTTEFDRDFMERLNATLEQHLEDPDYSVSDFAAEMMMGRSSFYSKVRTVTGYSPNEYIRVLRLKRAAELLLSTRMTSAEISFKVGIHDPSYFSKCFKEQFGVTPKLYRKQIEEQQAP